MSPLERFRYHVADDEASPDDAAARAAQTFRAAMPEGLHEIAEISFNSDEAAAKFYLSELLETDGRDATRGVLSPEDSGLVPGLRHVASSDSPLTGTRIVRFEQTHASIPVFGTRADVELTPNRDLVSAGGSFGDVRSGISAKARLTVLEAAESVSTFTGARLSADDVVAGRLVWFQSSDDAWHLAWLLEGVPAGPPGVEPGASSSSSHLPGPSQRDEARVDYLVDAHDGAVLFYYSAAPTLDVPVKCRGVDEDGVAWEFWGRQVEQGFEMHDPLRRTKTYGLAFADLRTTPIPGAPIASRASDWKQTYTSAVSAHVNAMRVHDFYKSLLQRNGIDDAGMTLESIVDCTYGLQPNSQVWANAVWREGRMWYGQANGRGGKLVSLSRHLDVIAHELTHGVIEFSSKLVYRDQPGALNESFADIFGTLVKNWYTAPNPKDVSTWSWELGAGLGSSEGPLRDLSDPRRTNDPAHYRDRYQGAEDYGGVHTNSNIHNKAAHNLLTARDRGEYAFSVEDATVLLYLCMVRLPPLATFTDALETLTDVAKTFYSGNTAQQKRKLSAIRAAYAKVGISET